MLHTFYFSPSGTTGATVNILSDALGMETSHHDITVATPQIDTLLSDDVVLVAAPVYAGRIPPLVTERLAGLKGDGQKAVVIVVYGNRDYDDALLELCDLTERNGFEIMAGGAFIGEHCIFPPVAAGRPDAGDRTKLHEFAAELLKSLAMGGKPDLEKIKGHRPYKKIAGVPLNPKVDEKLCDSCGRCARECPAGAIPTATPGKTDASKCITCCRCIRVCPKNARHLGGLLYKVAGWKFVKDNSRRLEPEWFL